MSRQSILEAIRKNKPETIAAPAPYSSVKSDTDTITAFRTSVERAGGTVQQLSSRNEIAAAVQQHYPQASIVADFVHHPSNSHQNLLHDAASIEVTVLEGQLGVAENGAIFLHESDCVNRALPFITHNLVLVLDKSKLVHDMHDAYATIDTMKEGFGVFIAGPSKTADIEQSLVIGAHGAKSLLVLLA
ncbi:LUD domain-containing protein [Pseudoflavitalea sp. G-6-1-2]|uniref:LUD domain-containing protein n=1 Tax=Pseudoflavitalea sp. G-6-1-2 TaxID=2728841 RepID=UPI00146D00A6|nr:LUD domain-containing protein [Pseudoflavitalea sp. G-6-1-2]